LGAIAAMEAISLHSKGDFNKKIGKRYLKAKSGMDFTSKTVKSKSCIGLRSLSPP
jgi:hypothetical protein